MQRWLRWLRDPAAQKILKEVAILFIRRLPVGKVPKQVVILVVRNLPAPREKG